MKGTAAGDGDIEADLAAFAARTPELAARHRPAWTDPAAGRAETVESADASTIRGCRRGAVGQVARPVGVTAESDRDRWDCEPLERAGPLRFGVNPQDAITVMAARAFTSDAAPVENAGPLTQARARFREADASGGQADVAACFVDSGGPARVGRAAREHLGTWLEEHPERAVDIVGRIVKCR